MASRQPHTKSRRGCIQCKARRIKCDGAKPNCDNCTRVAKKCSFLQAVPRLPLSFSPLVPAPEPGVLNPPTNPSLPLGIPEFTVHDLELLHHFTVSTSRTFSTSSNSHKFWHTTVVQLAFQHEFLLHMIMAISALHMFYTDATKSQLLTISQRHRDIAIESSRLAISNITQTNCDALFAFSLLVFIHVFAPPQNKTLSGRSMSKCDDSQSLSWQWVRMARGIRAVLDTSWHWIQHGPLSEMILLNPWTTSSPISLQALQRVDTQLSLLEQTWCQPSASCRSGRHEALVFSEALSQLRLTYSQAYSFWFIEDDRHLEEADNGMRIAGVVFLWLIKVPVEYITLLEAENAEALLIFTYYAVLLGIFPRSWWSNDRANRVITSIRPVLDKKWHSWLDWPIEELKRLDTGRVERFG